MDDIILVGGGGHCRSVIDVVEVENKYRIAGIVDIEDNIGKSVLGYDVIGDDKDLEKLAEKYKYAVITVGQIESTELRIKLFEAINIAGFVAPLIVSPLAYVSRHATIGEGTVVMHGSFVNANACIGRNCIVNTKAIVEHDCKVGDNCHISTGAIVNGNVQVGENSFIGSNAVTKQSVIINKNSFVKAGSVVA